MKGLLTRADRSRAIFPDPHGLVSFGLAASVLLGYLGLDASASHLFSENLVIEVLGHAWLLLGPPAAVILAVRTLLFERTSPVPLATLPLAGFLTILGFAGAALGLFFA